MAGWVELHTHSDYREGSDALLPDIARWRARRSRHACRDRHGRGRRTPVMLAIVVTDAPPVEAFL
jgi:hypothetical protein